jgi:hypothetical protein
MGIRTIEVCRLNHISCEIPRREEEQMIDVAPSEQ